MRSERTSLSSCLSLSEIVKDEAQDMHIAIISIIFSSARWRIPMPESKGCWQGESPKSSDKMVAEPSALRASRPPAFPALTYMAHSHDLFYLFASTGSHVMPDDREAG